MSVAVGPLAAAERAAAVALWRAAGLTRPWNDPDRDLALALGCAAAEVLAARDGGELVGTAMVGFDGHRGWLYYVAVDPARRGAGIGRALVAAAEAWLAARDAPKAQLMVRDDNPAARGFWARLGYELQPAAVLGRRLDGVA